MNIQRVNFQFLPKVSFGRANSKRNFQNRKPQTDTFERRATTPGNYPLIKKYKLNPDEIEIKSNDSIYIDKEQKALFIEKLLEAHELAKKNVNMGNLVGLGFASNMCLADDTWHLATNFNNTRNDISSICGERSAVIVAYNDFLKKALEEKTGETTSDFRVKYIAMSSAKPLGEDKNASSPCADCLSWFNTTKHFDDDAKIVFFTKDKKENKMYLEFRTLKEILPMRGRDEIDSMPNSSSTRLTSIVMSSDAKRIMDEKGIDTDDIRKTLLRAKERYLRTDFTTYSSQNIAACIQTRGHRFTAPKIDWSKRWFVEPAEFAIAKSFEKFNETIAPDIIAYYGDNLAQSENTIEKDGIVSIKTLGRIKAIDPKSEPLIVLVNDNDEIDVRSINDYMPNMFKQTYVK